VIFPKDKALFYRVIKYADGKIKQVNDFYSSGKKEMEGIFNIYCAEAGFKNGPVTYYWENGLKREEGHYKEGALDGCFFLWKENGECMWASNGCKCIDQNKISKPADRAAKSSAEGDSKTLPPIQSNSALAVSKMAVIETGNWRGDVTQQKVKQTYIVTATWNAPKSYLIISYPAYGCYGTWTIESASDASLDVRETITTGRCNSGGLIRLSYIDDNQIKLEYFKKNENVSNAGAILKRS
jgi:hypothetical protein